LELHVSAHMVAIRSAETLGLCVDDRRELDLRIEYIAKLAARAASLAGGGEAPAIVPAGAPAAGSRAASLAWGLGLEPDEVDFLFAVVARAVDPRVGSHLRAVFGTDARGGLSLGQYAALCALPAARTRNLLAVIDPRHPLRAHGLIELVGTSPDDIDARWTAASRVWGYLGGSDKLDPALAELGGLVVLPTTVQLSFAQRDMVAKLASWLAPHRVSGNQMIIVEGPTGSGRRTAVAMALGPRPAIAIDFARVSIADAERTLIALRREATLTDAVPVLANLDELWSKVSPSDDALLSIASAIDRIAGPIVVTTSTPGLDLRARCRNVVRAAWPVPDAPTRRSLWQDTGSIELSTTELELVAQRYELGAGGILAAVRSAESHASHRGDGQAQFGDLVAGVRDNIAERLGDLAHRIEINQDWSELVLPPDTLEDVRSLVARVQHAPFVLEKWGFRRKLARGAGVAALFSGPPGTGKTMVAGLLAKQLGLELYQVDLSRIVSKWVGETEKQLAKVFEAAEAGHALLLFDEADSLFAKRSAEVKSATDRYANLEVNYLLQRVESFGGVVIMTTNLDASIDPALRRRLAAHIVFGSPEVDERETLWREMLATGAPLGPDIPFAELAEDYPAMTGANIRNAVLAAAFLAAETGTCITGDHLRRAARGEYRAMGHVLGKDHQRSGSRL
jgi:hypothetical protein